MTKLGRAPRVAVVGVRRVRAGLGQFIAKHLVAQGAAVPAFVASREETIEEGRATLGQFGIDARGYVDLEALLDADPVDALAIASPHETHFAWLRDAVAHGLHVLCEKPLVWGDPVPLLETQELIDAAADKELVLFENCPWPYALPAFDALHPAARSGGVRTFEMEMSPSSSGRAMLVDALSHPISVLQEFAPLGEARLLIHRWTKTGQDRIDVEFAFEGLGAPQPIRATVRLRHVPRQPRPLAIVVNGLRADRRTREDDYAQFLASPDGREVPLPDPMAALIGDFVRALADGEPPDVVGRRMWRIPCRMRLLREIVRSFPAR